MSVAIKGGGSSAGVANVDAGYNLNVTLPQSDTYAGKARIMSEGDAGTVTGSVLLRSPETDDDYRLRIAHDTLLDFEVFNYAAQNTGKHRYDNTTMTAAWSSGTLTTNSGSITTVNTGVGISSWQSFPMFGAAPTWCETTAALNATSVGTNTTINFGLFARATAGSPFTPSDGAYFRWNNSGLFGVVNASGSESTTSVFAFTPVANQQYKFLVVVAEKTVEFWIDDVLYATKDRTVSLGTPFTTPSAPWSVRHDHAGGAASVAVQLKVAKYTVSLGGYNYGKPWPHVAARMGMVGQGLSGGTMGSVASYPNSTNPTGSGGSNTAANVTGLGGTGAINATASATTDTIASSYQNPARSATYIGRTLYVTGVRISAVNIGAAVATTPTTLAWAVAWGHTAVSLATAEAANAKAPRRMPLGYQSAAVGTAVGGTYAPDIYMPFNSPLAIAPGEFFATYVKQRIGTATASQVIEYTVTVDHYWGE